MKILVCGSRWYDGPAHRARLTEILDQLSPTHIVHGAAPGADYMADYWCRKHGVDFTRVPANWRIHGKKAGPLRNIQMLDEHPDIELVVAFPLEGSIGTWHMVKEADKRGIPTMVVDNPHED